MKIVCSCGNVIEDEKIHFDYNDKCRFEIACTCGVCKKIKHVAVTLEDKKMKLILAKGGEGG